MFTYREHVDGVGVAFTDRHGGVSPLPRGSLNLGAGMRETSADLAENFRRVTHELGVKRVVALQQVHGSHVVVVDDEFCRGWGDESHLAAPTELPVGDAIVTAQRAEPPLALTIRVADCVPVLFADPARGVIGAAHAGRPGFAADVVGATIEAMHHLGAQDIHAWMGPHVCGQCYEVPAQMRDDVAALYPDSSSQTFWGTPALDLGAGVETQLRSHDVDVTRLQVCTLESADHHSYRRDGVQAGRLAAFIWLT